MEKNTEEVGSRDRSAVATARALKVLAIMRAHGAQFYREYMAIRAAPASRGICESVIMVEPQTLGRGGFVASGALATLADVTLGSAIRTALPSGRRTATAGLTLQILREEPTGIVRARAETESVTSDTGFGHCRLTDEKGRLLAFATGTFAIRSVPRDGAWLPYSRDGAITASSLPPLEPGQLATHERALLRHAEESLQTESPDGPYGAYLGIEWARRGHDEASGIWHLGPHLWNRVEHVQGGAMFGGLTVTALACLPDDMKARVVEQHVQYARPGRGERLRVQAAVLRRGQRLISAEARAVDEEGKTVAGSLVTLEGRRHSGSGNNPNQSDALGHEQCGLLGV